MPLRPGMPIRAAARSVSDATRFTAQMPHASKKATSPQGRKIPVSRQLPPAQPGRPGIHRTVAQETPEQRVARLRAAHLAAQGANISTLDRVADRVRPWMDTAHRMTVLSLVTLTGLAGIATIYTVVDMMRYNRKRKDDFFEMAKRCESDDVTRARLAYVRGDATPEQVELVEEIQATAHEKGIKLPPLFQEDSTTGETGGETDRIAAMGATPEEIKEAEKPTKRKQSWREWAFGNLKREEEGEDVGTAQARLGYESLSEEDDGTGVRESDVIAAVEAREREKRLRQTKAATITTTTTTQPAKEGQGKKSSWSSVVGT